jgi:hypothetical protein
MTDFNILNFGALGDGETNDAPSIQQAIDACHQAGGGRVIIPAGKVFRAGTLVMKSNVELHLENGAVLQASPRVEDYTARFAVGALTGGAVDASQPGAIMFITGEYAENISFSGNGVIDGGGRFFIAERMPFIYRMQRKRPFTFFLLGCRKVNFHDVTIRDGAVWTVRLSGCSDVLIHGIRIENDLKLPNSDGIDLDRCKDVRISDCHIVSGDDCIVLKTCEETASYGDGCENVIVSNCTLISTSIAICVGCECRAPMRNIIFDNCVIRASHRGLAVRLSEGSDVENVIFSNMIIETRLFHHAWWGSGEPINVIAVPWDAERSIGHVRNVRFNNILCRGENGVYVEGWTPDHMQNILFENVRVEIEKTSRWEGGKYDRRPCPTDWANQPEEGFLYHPVAGFLLNKAHGVTLRNCEVVWGENPPDYFRHALQTYAVEDLTIKNFRGESAFPDRYPAIQIEE